MRAEVKARAVILLHMAQHGIGLSVVLMFPSPSCPRPESSIPANTYTTYFVPFWQYTLG